MDKRPDTSSGKYRDAIRPGCTVDIVLKADQKSGKLTRGIVQEILTNSSFHPHGIKVRLKDGRVGRVAKIIGRDSAGTPVG
ncbi:MAG TPA: YwbE family protein [Methanoregula sp.]|nr:YwbE family protein [Methanoregula sp.]